MRQRSKRLLELLSGPSPNDFWFNLSKISHNDTSLFMFICLSKRMSQWASGCLCWWTIFPRVSFPRGDSRHNGSYDEKHRCQPICTGHFELLGYARRRWTLSLATLSCLFGSSGSLISRECGSYVYEKRDIRRPDNECHKVSLVHCRKVRLSCIWRVIE